MPEDKKIARMLIEEHIVVTQPLHNNFLSSRQLKCGESHMTYLARNTVKKWLFLPLQTSLLHCNTLSCCPWRLRTQVAASQRTVAMS